MSRIAVATLNDFTRWYLNKCVQRSQQLTRDRHQQLYAKLDITEGFIRAFVYLPQLAGDLMNLLLRRVQAEGQQLLWSTGEILKQRFMRAETEQR